MASTLDLIAVAGAAHDAGRLSEAEAHYLEILAREPAHPEILHNLGLICGLQGRLLEATAYYMQALGAQPDFPEAHCNLGNVLVAQGLHGEAAAAYERATILRPGMVEAEVRLGASLVAEGRVQEGIDRLCALIGRQPQLALAHSNLGSAYHQLQQLEAALACFDRALALDPTHALAHFNRSLVLLSLGRYAEAWPEYEWRWRCAEFYRRQLPRPSDRWDGGSLHGRTLLVYAEQGMGDTLMMARYLPLVRQHGGRLVLHGAPALRRLLEDSALADRITTDRQPLPHFDRHAALMSLPGIFGTTPSTIPASVPYLKVRRERLDAWRTRLGHASDVRVGICWQGNRDNSRDRHRSVALAPLARALDVPGVTRYSIQKPTEGEPTPDLRELGVMDAMIGVIDFADTAAVASQLDLIVTVDTAVAHLAGALGKPVWVLLPLAADWRWLTGTQEGLWYPTARIFRQAEAGSWQPVFDALRAALIQKLNGPGT